VTPREKVLSIGVAVAVSFVAVNYGLQSVRKGLEVKSNEADRLRSELTRRDTIITDGLLDRLKINMVSLGSLPTNREKAAADYRSWLITLINEAGLSQSKQSFIGDTDEKGVYRKLKFAISGRGTIENLTKLLHQYYSKDYLHRISQLKISLVPREAYQLDINLVSEVLAIDAASATQKEPESVSHRVAKSIQDYDKTIVGRNLFSPANHQPKLASTASTQAIKGEQLSFKPSVSDSDPGQSVRFEIIGDRPEDMRIDGATGALAWTPVETGSTKVKIRATDNGLPATWAEQEVTIAVSDPPPPIAPPKPELKMDVAAQSFVSALLAGREGPEAWVRSRMDGKTIYLKKGDQLSLGSVQGTVTSVGANYIELETEGVRWTVGLDESLADAYQRMKTD
jgi:hypothetical protein